MDAEKILIISLMLFVVGLVLSISDGPKKKAPPQDKPLPGTPPPELMERDKRIEAARLLAVRGADHADRYTRREEPEQEIQGKWPGLPPLVLDLPDNVSEETKDRARAWLKEQSREKAKGKA
jgi:hypothetical protein